MRQKEKFGAGKPQGTCLGVNFLSVSVPFLIDTLPIRNTRKLLKLKTRYHF
jgi:hypothetical protein